MHQSAPQIIEDIVLAYVKSAFAAKNVCGRYYNFVFYLRWAVYSCIVTIWYEWPRTIYAIFLGLNFLVYLYTLYIWIAGGFKRPAGFYIFFSETCILFRHTQGLAKFIDYFGTKGFSKGHDQFWGLFALCGFFFGTIAEIILLLEPYFNSDNQAVAVEAPKPAAKRLLIADDDELFVKVNTYQDNRAVISQNNQQQPQFSNSGNQQPALNQPQAGYTGNQQKPGNQAQYR